MTGYGELFFFDHGEQEDGDEDNGTNDEMTVPPYPSERVGIEEKDGCSGDDTDDRQPQHLHHTLDNAIVTVQ